MDDRTKIMKVTNTCMEQGKTPRSHPWRPTLGYETVEAFPLHSQPLTNQLMDSRCTPSGMSMEPMKFPNLVTGFDRNPKHAARTALHTRYTAEEWAMSQINLYNEANANRHYSEKLRSDTTRLMREADETVQEGQMETGRKLGERITDISFWRNEVSSELEKLLTEATRMQDAKRILQSTIDHLEGQLHIAQECLYYRESRKGTELVHDKVEQALLHEVETVKNAQLNLGQYTERCNDQLNKLRAVQNELEIDVKNKEVALGIDTMCHQLNNYSRGLQYYGGIEKYDPSLNDIDSWTKSSNGVVNRSQSQRGKAKQLRSDIEAAITGVGHNMWDAWTDTNDALSTRGVELLDAKGKLQTHLHKIQQEIYYIEKNMELIQKGIEDKSSSLKVAHTRLEARIHRPDAELCKDKAEIRMKEEIDSINSMINNMNEVLQKYEAQHQQLLRTRSNLEDDLKFKVDALFIDREKCGAVRRSYPVGSIVKF